VRRIVLSIPTGIQAYENGEGKFVWLNLEQRD